MLYLYARIAFFISATIVTLQMIGFCPLASGSKGNCIYLGTTRAKILIDAGISCKNIAERLFQIGVDLSEIEAILITHEHVDHIRGVELLSRKYNIPLFANSDTAKAICSILGGTAKFKIFSTGESFLFKEMQIHPFSIQHDAVDPVAFTIHAEGLKLGFCTDLGFATTLVQNHLRGCDYLYLEANHQPSMVHASARPLVYKKRVLSRQGHLSNEECAELLLEVFHPGLKHVHLAHLSSECNSPELALQIIGDKLRERGQTLPLSIAYQDRISQQVRFSAQVLLQRT